MDAFELDNFTFASAVVAMKKAEQTGSDVVFDFGGGDVLTIENVTIAQLVNDVVLV